MYILVNHRITMPAEFWGATTKYLNNFPGNDLARIVSVFPNENMDQCTSIWEAASIETLHKYLRKILGHSSQESYYQINEANSLGLKK